MKTRRNFYLLLLFVAIACRAATVLPKITVAPPPSSATKAVPTFTYNLDPSMY